jgi:signal recognition particle subunit SRP54
MTEGEKTDPKILNPPRIRRVAWGSGTSEREVKELVNQFFTMRKMMKMIRRRRIPFLQKFPGQIK